MNTQALLAQIEGATIRITEDGKVSVIDVIKEVTGYSGNTASKTLERMKTDSPDISTNLSLNTFGRGRPTPVADRKTIVNIMQMLPGIAGDKFRAATAELVLKYLDADINLAADIADRSSEEEQKWLEARLRGKSTRNTYTRTLQRHGVHDDGYAKCTDAINVPILGARASVVKKEMGLANSANLRDNLPSMKLTALMFAEDGASNIIEKKDAFGNAECELLSSKAAAIVAGALRDMELLAA